jgi:hypothetical protein
VDGKEKYRKIKKNSFFTLPEDSGQFYSGTIKKTDVDFLPGSAVNYEFFDAGILEKRWIVLK